MRLDVSGSIAPRIALDLSRRASLFFVCKSKSVFIRKNNKFYEKRQLPTKKLCEKLLLVALYIIQLNVDEY